MFEIFTPEIPGLEPPNPGISGLRKMSGIPVFGIPGLESLYVSAYASSLGHKLPKYMQFCKVV
jgi:hypothetical protein